MVRKKYATNAWPFYLDQVEEYAYWENLFTKEECEKIVKIAYKKGLTQGTTVKKEAQQIRNSKVSWLYASDDLDWVFRRLTDVVIDLNNRFFKFDIFGLNEGLQFTNYKAPSGKYGKHVDKLYKNLVRKLSGSIQLTNPKEYNGGELYLYQNAKGELMNQKQGTLILFPSYIMHEVKPVTKGERNSLVFWVTGKQFK